MGSFPLICAQNECFLAIFGDFWAVLGLLKHFLPDQKEFSFFPRKFLFSPKKLLFPGANALY